MIIGTVPVQKNQKGHGNLDVTVFKIAAQAEFTEENLNINTLFISSGNQVDENYTILFESNPTDLGKFTHASLFRFAIL